VLPKGDALASRKSLSAADLLERELVAFDPDLGSVQGATASFSDVGHLPIPIVGTNDYRVMRSSWRLAVATP
jgi:hypothetical protein